KNARYSFDCYNLENGKYVLRTFNAKDVMDTTYVLGELCYEYASGGRQLYDVKFSSNALENVRSVDYTDLCGSSSYLFGCVCLRSKQYAILNKQYTKEEYEELLPKILQHMNDMPYRDAKGREYR